MTITEMMEELNVLEDLIGNDTGRSAKITREYISHIRNSFKNYYFILGTSQEYPYQDSYLIIKADSRNEAIKKFIDRFEPTHVFGFYSEDEWNQDISTEHYHDMEPVVIIY